MKQNGGREKGERNETKGRQEEHHPNLHVNDIEHIFGVAGDEGAV